MRGRGMFPLGYVGLQMALLGSSVLMPTYMSQGYDYNSDRPRRPPRLEGEPCKFRPTGGKRARRRARAKQEK